MTDPVVLRAPLRSRRDDVDVTATIARALALGVVGMGAADDERAARRLDRLAAMPDGTFAWTHDAAGFHLGRIDGPLVEDGSAEAVALDLVHVRACRWLPEVVDPALVPEQVTYAFGRGGRNLQRIATAGAGRATAETWDLLS